MIIRQTTTIVFEYPQDYLQEQEWCKTKDDRWVHKSTDTLGAVYENTISYSIGQPSNSEKPNNLDKDINVRSKDEPQTNADQHVQHVESVEPMQTEREGE